MSSASAMVASCGCALITSFKGLTCFASTSAVSGFKGTEQPWKRRFTIKSIGLGPYGRGRLLQQKRANVELSQTFSMKKSAVVSQAPNARVSASKGKQSVASKEKNDRRPDKSRSEVIDGKNQKQEGKIGISSANMSESTSIATRQVVVKDGFAGLSALKAQLEQERPRISRVKENDVSREFLPQQKHRAELRRRQEAVKSAISRKSDDLLTKEASIPSKLPSSDEPIRDGDTTTTAAAGKEVPFAPSSSSSSSSSSSLKKELSKVNPRVKKQGGGLRDVWKGQLSSLQTDATELRSAKESSSHRFRTPNGGKPDSNSKNTTTDMEAVQNLNLVVERDSAEMVRSSSNADSLKGLNSRSATKLSGASVLEALQRAAALRDNKLKSRRKGRPGGGKYSSDSDSDEDSKQDPLPPLVFKPEWASKIEELQNDLKQLRMLS